MSSNRSKNLRYHYVERTWDGSLPICGHHGVVEFRTADEREVNCRECRKALKARERASEPRRD